ncbi:MAG: MCE family protein [Deltaproteobacteria bacterium]|nr:MCE family protein [Deltaproteobacteria bacterium]
MRKSASKTVIGIFVVSALALVVAGVLIFGSGDFLKERYKFVLFFQDSVKGLNVGAPVVFLGVKIGEVKDIAVIQDPSKSSFYIQVIIELTSGKIKRSITKEFSGVEETYEYCNQLIKQGLRAELGLQSVVTGQLQIELDFHPEEKAILLGGNDQCQEIPTIPSKFEKLTKTLENLPLEEIVEKLSSSLNRIDALLNSPEIPEILKSMKLAMEDARQFSHKVNKQIQPMIKKLDAVLEAHNKIAQSLDQQMDPLTSNIQELVEVVTEASKQADKTLKTLENLISEDSIATVELTTTLKEFSSAARSIRNLADYLNRHPETIVRGKTVDIEDNR